jgi:hypothetical protein
MTYHVFFHFPCNDGELSRVIWEHFEPLSKFYKWYHNNVNHEDDINIINNVYRTNVKKKRIIDLTENTHGIHRKGPR